MLPLAAGMFVMKNAVTLMCAPELTVARAVSCHLWQFVARACLLLLCMQRCSAMRAPLQRTAGHHYLLTSLHLPVHTEPFTCTARTLSMSTLWRPWMAIIL